MSADTTTSPHPNIDKLQEVSDRSQVIGEFLEWLVANGMMIHEWRTGLSMWSQCSHCEGAELVVPCRYCDAEGGKYITVDDRYLPTTKRAETLLAEFFGINLSAVERERRAILASLNT